MQSGFPYYDTATQIYEEENGVFFCLPQFLIERTLRILGICFLSSSTILEDAYESAAKTVKR